MSKERIIRLLEEQLKFAREHNRQLSEQLSVQADQLLAQREQIACLTETIQSLEEALKQKDISLDKEKAGKKALGRLLANKSEKISVENDPCAEAPAEKKAPSPKERGNNNAHRKVHFNLETVEHDVYPEEEGFDLGTARLLSTEDSIRYEFFPSRFIKHIYHHHYYIHEDKIVHGEVPATPMLNSCYESSFLAGILQLRFIYSMPIERIIKYFGESGFELPKSTAHDFIRQVAVVFECLGAVLRKAIKEDDYIHMDETHYTVLDRNTPKGSRKVYFWSALADTLKLVYFFYDNGSRAQKVMQDFLPPTYQGAVQTDGYAVYKPLETADYPGTIRLGCFQHCKRKFIDIGGNEDAREVIDIINLLYQKEHDLPPEASPPEIEELRKIYAPPILKRLEDKLLEIKNRKTTLPKSSLSQAVHYALEQLPSMSNYILDGRYQPDNNRIEQVQRYISLSRHNSLFCGSHKGAERAALIYSLACSCRLHNINTFEYFKCLLNKLILVTPNTSEEYLRSLLPDRTGWKE
jgi:transposase